MRRVSLREANQTFASCIREVEDGEHLVIERRGMPVAEIIPFRKAVSTAKRERAVREMMALLDRGIPMGGQAPSRDAMHER